MFPRETASPVGIDTQDRQSVPVLTTRRLILRPPVASDFDAWAAVMADEIASRYILGPLTRGQAWRSLCTMAGSWMLYGYGNFSVLEKESGRWVGRVGPWHPDPWPGPEIGWVFARDYWGRGYATEAARAAVDWVASIGWTRMVHVIHPENTASMAVARLGVGGNPRCRRVDVRRSQTARIRAVACAAGNGPRHRALGG